MRPPHMALEAQSGAVMKKILVGATYVNIHPSRNAAGEIRGQIASG